MPNKKAELNNALAAPAKGAAKASGYNYCVVTVVLACMIFLSQIGQFLPYTEGKVLGRPVQAFDLTLRSAHFDYRYFIKYDDIAKVAKKLSADGDQKLAEKNYAEAEQLYLRALAIQRQLSLGSHPEEKIPQKMFPEMRKLANCLDLEGKHDAASLCRHNIDMLEKSIASGNRLFSAASLRE